MKRLFLLATAAALALAPAAASACSPAPGYRVPSNLELVSAAETIVLAKVVGGTAPSNDPAAVSITIRPLEAIKGDMPQGDIMLVGPGLATIGGFQLSNPFEFREAHPNAYSGACNRYLFPLGTTALFFLRTDHEGMWAAATGGAFTRWAEDVPDAQAPWVQLVRLYTVAASLPEADRGPFLEDEREALLARAGEPLAQLMADDIAHQIAPAASLQDPVAAAPEESTVEAMLKAMRQNAVEAGN